MFVSKLTIIGSDNGLLSGRCQAIIGANDGILLIGPNFSEILIDILIFSFMKMHSKVSSGKWWPFCLRLNVLNHRGLVMHAYMSVNQVIISSSIGLLVFLCQVNTGINDLLSIGPHRLTPLFNVLS